MRAYQGMPKIRRLMETLSQFIAGENVAWQALSPQCQGEKVCVQKWGFPKHRDTFVRVP